MSKTGIVKGLREMEGSSQVHGRILEIITDPPTRTEEGSVDSWAPKPCTGKVLTRESQVAVSLPS